MGRKERKERRTVFVGEINGMMNDEGLFRFSNRSNTKIIFHTVNKYGFYACAERERREKCVGMKGECASNPADKLPFSDSKK